MRDPGDGGNAHRDNLGGLSPWLGGHGRAACGRHHSRARKRPGEGGPNGLEEQSPEFLPVDVQSHGGCSLSWLVCLRWLLMVVGRFCWWVCFPSRAGYWEKRPFFRGWLWRSSPARVSPAYLVRLTSHLLEVFRVRGP